MSSVHHLIHNQVIHCPATQSSFTLVMMIMMMMRVIIAPPPPREVKTNMADCLCAAAYSWCLNHCSVKLNQDASSLNSLFKTHKHTQEKKSAARREKQAGKSQRDGNIVNYQEEQVRFSCRRWWCFFTKRQKIEQKI